MKRSMATVWLAVFAVALGVPSHGFAQGAVHRLSAQFDTWGSPPEIFTANPPLDDGQGGLSIYNKTVDVPLGDNVLFFTFSGTGDSHGGSRTMLAANVDGVPFNDGANPVAESPRGWLTVQRHHNHPELSFGGDGGGGPGDLHDNSIHTTWCTRITPGQHRVELRLASGPNPVSGVSDAVFLEGNHYLIDSARLIQSNACTDVIHFGAGRAGAVDAPIRGQP